MHAENGSSMFVDLFFDFPGIDRPPFFVDIRKDGSEAAPDDRICRGNKGEGCRNDLSLEIERLQTDLQRIVSVGEELEFIDSQILFQRPGECDMFFSDIRDPATVPEGRDLPHVFINRRHGRFRDQNFIHISYLFHSLQYSRKGRFMPTAGQNAQAAILRFANHYIAKSGEKEVTYPK